MFIIADTVSVSFVTSGDWKEFVDFVSSDEKVGLSSEDHSVWTDIFGPESSVVLRSRKDESILGVMFFAAFKPGLVFFGPIFTRKAARESEVAWTLFKEAKKHIENTSHPRDIKCLFANHMSWSMCFSWGFTTTPTWNLQMVTVRGIKLSKLRLFGWGDEISLVNTEAISQHRIMNYDHEITGGVHRSAWLRYWLKHPTAHAKVALDCEGQIRGFGMFREVLMGQPRALCAGPIYADTMNAAKAILYATLSSFPCAEKREVIFYTVANDTKLRELLADDFQVSLLVSTSELFPLFSGQQTEYSLEKIYSATDPRFSFI